MMRINAHYLLSKHSNNPKALRCLAFFTDDCKAILQSHVLKDVGHLRNWHCQHPHRVDPCDPSESQWEMSCTQFRTVLLIILLARKDNSP